MKKIAISPGDPAGVGPDICLKAFKKNIIFDWKFGLNKEEISYVTENWESFRDY